MKMGRSMLLLLTVATAALHSVTSSPDAMSIDCSNPTPPPIPGMVTGQISELKNITGSCTLTFEVDSGTPLYFILYDADKLSKDSMLQFYNGPANDENVIVNMTTSPDFVQVVSAFKTNTICYYVIFNTSSITKLDLDLTMDFQPNSGMVQLPPADGRFRAPIFLAEENNDVNVTYSVNALSVEYHVGVSFDEVDLKRSSVKIMEKNGTVLRSYKDGTGHMSDEVLVDGSSINLILDRRQAGTSEQTTFTASYIALNQDCSMRQKIDKQMVVIQSPAYPENYRNNLHCWWILEVEDTKAWSTFEIEMLAESFADRYDELIINDGDSRLSQGLATQTKGTNMKALSLRTSGPRVFMSFTTDQVLTAEGFNLTVRPLPFGGLAWDSGSIDLQPRDNETRHDPNMADDVVFWIVSSDPMKQIELHLNASTMFPTAQITCYEGVVSAESARIASFTSQTPFYPVFSASYMMLVIASGFLTNGTLNQQGFSGNFMSVPISNKRKNSGSMSDSFSIVDTMYPETASWTILPHEDQTISLSLSNIHLAKNGSLTVQQGLAETANQIIRIKSSTQDVPLVYVQDQGVRVTYRGSGGDIGPYDSPLLMQAAYKVIPACGHDFVNVSRANFSTPQHPNQYPYNARCRWSFSIPENKSMHLATKDFMLAGPHSLTVTAVVVTEEKDGNTTVKNKTTVSYGTYHSDQAPEDFIISGSNATVEFSSEFDGDVYAYDVSTGFSANMEIIDCGGNMTSDAAGVISVLASNTSQTCVWIVSVPAEGVANGSVNILQYTVTMAGYRNQSFILSVRDGGSESDEDLPVDMKNGTSKPALTRYNKLWVRFQGHANDSLSLNLNYSIHECGAKDQCGNGMCLHADWRCNGVDDCGDGTDEVGCQCVPGDYAFRGWQMGVAVVFSLIGGIVLALGIPVCMRKLRAYRNPAYTEFVDAGSPDA